MAKFVFSDPHFDSSTHHQTIRAHLAPKPVHFAARLHSGAAENEISAVVERRVGVHGGDSKGVSQQILQTVFSHPSKAGGCKGNPYGNKLKKKRNGQTNEHLQQY